jgi:hypothetical protein
MKILILCKIKSNSAMISRISFIFFICFQILVGSTVQSATFNQPVDSLKMKTMNGKSYLLHKVAPKETWSHLAKKYNCTVEELIQANNGIEIIKIDQIVNVPVKGNAVAEAKIEHTKVNESANNQSKPKTATGSKRFLQLPENTSSRLKPLNRLTI